MLGVLMVIVYIITGAAVIVGAVFGAAWLLAREINAGHEPTCGCPDCQRKRLARRRAQRGQEEGGEWGKDRKPPPSRGAWMSTLELCPGMRVHGKAAGSVYRVESVDPQPSGYTVVLVNLATGSVSRIAVEGDKAQQRIWLVRRPKGSVE